MTSKLKMLIAFFKQNRYLTIFLFCFLGIFYAFNVKTLLLVFIFTFITIYLFTPSSLAESVFFTLIISLPFEKNIRQWILYSPVTVGPSGYAFYFGINHKQIFEAIILLLFLIPKNKLLIKKITPNICLYLLLLFFGLSSILNLFSQQRLLYPFIGYLRLGFSLSLFFIGQVFWDKKNSPIIVTFLVVLTVFTTFFGLFQVLKQHPIGNFIELTPSFSQLGYFTTDGTLQYRVAGFFSHPVYFGSFLCILIPIIIGISFKYFRPLLAIVPPLVIVTLSTQSRSTWINLIFIALFYFIYFVKNSQSAPKLKSIIIICLISLLTIVPFSFTRFQSISTIFQGNNSGIFRLNMAQLSYKIFIQNPIIGSGLNNFSFETYRQHLTSSFSAPPHNTILIFLVELGLPATLLFLIFLYLLLAPSKKIFTWPILQFSFWLGLMTFTISSQFHPLFNLDPTFDIFMVLAGIYSQIKISSPTSPTI